MNDLVQQKYQGNHKVALTVHELIKLLQWMPQDAHVHCTCEGGSCETGVYGLNRLESLDQDPPYVVVVLEGW